MTIQDIEKERLYTAALASLPGLGSRRVCSLIGRFGSAAAAWDASAVDWQDAGIPEAVGTALTDARSRYDWDEQLRLLSRYHTKLVALREDDYPQLLRETYNPPPVLYYQGALPQFPKAAAIVGARKATPYGRNAAQTLAEQMARSGIAVVSGGARGIDTKAHRGALAGKGITCAVVANGLDTAYPPENKSLFADIIEKGGSVVSEYAFGVRPLAINFPARNRIIAGLCRCVVVTEAALRSGSLITADFALEEGRDVFAVPGSIYSEMSRGTNALLRKGAIALTGIEDILSEYGWDAEEGEQSALPFSLTLLEEALLEALPCDRPMTQDELVVKTKLPPSQLSPLLLKLQLYGLIEETGGTSYVKKPGQ